MIIIPDTNFLIYLAKYKIAHELEKFYAKFLIPTQVIEELNRMASKNGKNKEPARLALIIVEKLEKKGKLKRKQVKEKLADDAVIKLALENKLKDCFVATHDKELMKRLKKAKISLIGVRQKKFLKKYY